MANCYDCGLEATHKRWWQDECPTDRGVEVRNGYEWVCDECDPPNHGQDNNHGPDEKAPNAALGDKPPVQTSTLSIGNGLGSAEPSKPEPFISREFLDRTSREVDAWPEWKRRGADTSWVNAGTERTEQGAQESMNAVTSGLLNHP